MLYWFCVLIWKVLCLVVVNVENNKGIDLDILVIFKVFVD